MSRPSTKRTRQVAAALRRRLRAAVKGAVVKVRRKQQARAAAAAFRPPANLARHWDYIVSRLARFGGASLGNSATIFSDGDTGFESLWEALSQARRSIWFEMYIVENDRVGVRTIEELTQAAFRGCRVTFLYDAVGSSSLPKSALKPLRDAGAKIITFNPIRPWRWPSSWLRRDHRKIIIVDGKIGFSGGMNVSEDYAGKRYGNERFKDCMVRLEGPVVRDLAAVLGSSWKAAGGEKLHLPRRKEAGGKTIAQVLSSHGATGRRHIQRSLRMTIGNAVTHCYITSPYLVPPLRLVNAIKRAADRGVDVRILTAGVSDVPIVHLAAQSIYARLLRHGVRIYEMVNRTLHAKTITIDGLYSTVGSFNLDTWSDKRNLEVNVAMIDTTIAAQMQQMFLKEIETAQEITLITLAKRPWWRRAIQWCAYQLLRL